MVDSIVEEEAEKPATYQELRSRAKNVLGADGLSEWQVTQVLRVADLTKEIHGEMKASDRVKNQEVTLGDHGVDYDQGKEQAWSGKEILKWIIKQDEGYRSYLDHKDGPSQLLRGVEKTMTQTYRAAERHRLLAKDSPIHEKIKPWIVGITEPVD